MRVRVQGLGFKGFRIQGVGPCGTSGLGCKVWGPLGT